MKSNPTPTNHHFHPLVQEWLQTAFKGELTPPQEKSLHAIRDRKNVLISAPTGTGKTLAAFLPIIDQFVKDYLEGKLANELKVIYVSPLKALSNDMERNLVAPIKELEELAQKKGQTLPITVAIRTGDTTATARKEMGKNPPHILITTPESLAIMLTTPTFRPHFKNVERMVVDEVHSLLDNKRGTQLSLVMEQLQEMAPNLQRIGLSATMEPLSEAAHFLCGYENAKKARACEIVDVRYVRSLELDVSTPFKSFIHISMEEANQQWYEALHQEIQSHQTTLIFTNTRAMTEKVVAQLREMYPGTYEGLIEAHHSSLSKEHRFWVEKGLKEGRFKAVVCSTSLELGIDIGFIDLVVLLGSPKSVAKTLQRIGRSGHRLHATVNGHIMVQSFPELVESVVIGKQAREKKLESVRTKTGGLDVLSQQVVACSVANPVKDKDLFKLVQKSHAFHQLNWDDFLRVLSYLSGKDNVFEGKRFYPKIRWDPKSGLIECPGKMTQVIYWTNGGTIPDQTKVLVKVKDQAVGSIDEEFLEKLSKGDVFSLGGRSYAFSHASGMVCFVKASGDRRPTVPRWSSEGLSISSELSQWIGDWYTEAEERASGKKKPSLRDWLDKQIKEETIQSEAENFLFNQRDYMGIPTPKKLWVEHFRMDGLDHAVLHSFSGKRAHQALGEMLEMVLRSLGHPRCSFYASDQGIVFSNREKLPLMQAIGLIQEKDVAGLMRRAAEESEIFARRFRHCCQRGLLILRQYRGQHKSVGKQQVAARIWLSAFRENDNQFPLYQEALREVVEDAWDEESVLKWVKGVQKGTCKVVEKTVPTPSPLGIYLYMEAFSDAWSPAERYSVREELFGKIEETMHGQRSNPDGKFMIKYK